MAAKQNIPIIQNQLVYLGNLLSHLVDLEDCARPVVVVTSQQPKLWW